MSCVHYTIFSVAKLDLFIRALLLDRILALEKNTRMLRVHLVNKDDSFLLETKIMSTREAPQEMDAKFRFAIHPQGICGNCQIAKCQTVATLAPIYIIICIFHSNKYYNKVR